MRKPTPLLPNRTIGDPLWLYLFPFPLNSDTCHAWSQAVLLVPLHSPLVRAPHALSARGHVKLYFPPHMLYRLFAFGLDSSAAANIPSPGLCAPCMIYLSTSSTVRFNGSRPPVLVGCMYPAQSYAAHGDHRGIDSTFTSISMCILYACKSIN